MRSRRAFTRRRAAAQLQVSCKNKMYEADAEDHVVVLKNVPQSSVGAPNPIVLAGEHDVLLTYYLQAHLMGGMERRYELSAPTQRGSPWQL